MSLQKTDKYSVFSEKTTGKYYAKCMSRLFLDTKNTKVSLFFIKLRFK